MSHVSPTITGVDLGILMGAIVWVKDCPFDKTAKPNTKMTSEEMDAFYDRLAAIWVRLRDENGVEKARSEEVMIELTSQESRCLSLCVQGVLDECSGDPVELEVRVGNTQDVQRLADTLSLLLK